MEVCCNRNEMIAEVFELSKPPYFDRSTISERQVQAQAVSTSRPAMYGRNTAGTVTEPSAFW
jgi:hypothetical protein